MMTRSKQNIAKGTASISKAQKQSKKPDTVNKERLERSRLMTKMRASIEDYDTQSKYWEDWIEGLTGNMNTILKLYSLDNLR